jgi:hypothetical protein
LRKILFISLILFEVCSAQTIRFPPKITADCETAINPSWYNSSWGYRRELTIDYTKVSETLTNFPVLLSLASDTGLVRALTDGSDIRFTSSDGTTLIYHELETFTKSTGAIVAWINVPSVSHTVNTTLWMYYGNSSALAPTFNGWDTTKYSVVQHLENKSYEAFKYPEGVITATNGGVFLTTNNGTSWTEAGVGLTNTDVRAILISGSNLFVGTNVEGVFLTTNDGVTWTQKNSGLTTIYVHALAISGSNLLAGTVGGGVFYSNNNGTSWTASTGETNNNINAFCLFNSHIYMGANSGTIKISHNDGATWEEIWECDMGSKYIMSLAGISTTYLFAGTTVGAYVSTNSGTNWTAINNGLTESYIQSLAVSGTTLFAGSEYGVFKTTDYGANWSAAGLETQSIVSLFANGANLFAGTVYGGVFVSTNSGTSWTAVNNKLTATAVQCFAVSGSNLFAGTYEGGMGNYLLEPSAILMPDNTMRLYAHTLTYGSDRVVYFTSPNGYDWTYQDTVSSVVRNEIWYDENYSHYYIMGVRETSQDFELWESDDGLSFNIINEHVLPLGEAGAFDDYTLAAPSIWKLGTDYHMFYGGATTGANWKAGHAWSATGLTTWIKDPGNPMGQIDGVGGGDGVQVGNWYYSFGTTFLEEQTDDGGAAGESDSYLSRTLDYHNWDLSPIPFIMRTRPWEGTGDTIVAQGGQVCDAMAIERDDTSYFFYEGLRDQSMGDTPYRIGLVRIPGSLDSILEHHPYMYNSVSHNNNIKFAKLPFDALGKINRCVRFNSYFSYISFKGCTELNTATSLSVSAWVKIDTLKANSFVVSRNESDVKNWGMGTGSNSATVKIWCGNGSAYSAVTSAILDTASWHLWEMVYSGTTLKFYLDGVEKSTTPTGSVPVDIQATSYINVGRKGESFHSGYFNGKIDEVRISNDAKTAGWILTEHTNQNTPSTFITIE